MKSLIMFLVLFLLSPASLNAQQITPVEILNCVKEQLNDVNLFLKAYDEHISIHTRYYDDMVKNLEERNIFETIKISFQSVVLRINNEMTFKEETKRKTTQENDLLVELHKKLVKNTFEFNRIIAHFNQSKNISRDDIKKLFWINTLNLEIEEDVREDGEGSKNLNAITVRNCSINRY